MKLADNFKEDGLRSTGIDLFLGGLEVYLAGEVEAEDTFAVDTLGRHIHGKLDPASPVTPLRQLVFFSHIFAAAGLFCHWVERCPLLRFSNPNVPAVTNLMGRISLSVLAGQFRYSYITGLRDETVNPVGLGLAQHFTQENNAFALKFMREMPLKLAGQVLVESDSSLWRRLNAHVKTANEPLSFKNVTWVGDDEMSRSKVHNYRSLLSGTFAKRVPLATPCNEASNWEIFLADLLRPNGHPNDVQCAAVDNSASYTVGVINIFWNAQLVYDSIDVIQSLVEACNQIRRSRSGPMPRSVLI